jgi:hypothetical protein
MPCPEPITRIEYKPYPVKTPCPEVKVTPGIIFGCIWGCHCCMNHDWEIKLYRICGENKVLLYCERICSCDCFEFKVPYDDCYLLTVCPYRAGRNISKCKPMLTLKNVGVAGFRLEA